MSAESLASLQRISNRTLVERVHALHGRSCEITAKLVAHVYEMRRRKLHLDAGYPSMFEYCSRCLHMSEGQTMRLLNAADIARIYPAVLEMISSGEVHLTGLSELKPHIKPVNAQDLLSMAKHRSKRSIQEEIARRYPRPMPSTEIRPVRSSPAAVLGPISAVSADPASAEDGLDARPDDAEALAVLAEARAAAALHAAPPPRPPSYTKPVAAEVYKVSFGAGKDFTEKLAWATDLMRHRNPQGDMEVVLLSALDALIDRLLKQKFAKTDKPRKKGARAAASKSISADVKRKVVARDGYRCAYVSPDGQRCGCRAFLEFEHRKPRAKGGDHSEKNVGLFCRPHNQRAADHEFGESFMDQKRYGHALERYRNTNHQIREPGAYYSGLPAVAGDGRRAGSVGAAARGPARTQVREVALSGPARSGGRGRGLPKAEDRFRDLPQSRRSLSGQS